MVVSNFSFIPFRQYKQGLKPSELTILLSGPDGLENWIPGRPTFSGPVFDKVEKVLCENQFKLLITDDMRKCGPPLNFSETPPSEECEVCS